MVVAKNEATHESLADQFRAREVFKSYVALVHGVVKQESDASNNQLLAIRALEFAWRLCPPDVARYHSIKFAAVLSRSPCSMLNLKTGRTHQIRVHLSWLKHPVVGDEVYGGGRDKTVQDVRLRAAIRKLQRQFLHAERWVSSSGYGRVNTVYCAVAGVNSICWLNWTPLAAELILRIVVGHRFGLRRVCFLIIMRSFIFAL